MAAHDEAKFTLAHALYECGVTSVLPALKLKSLLRGYGSAVHRPGFGAGALHRRANSDVDLDTGVG